MSPNIRSRPVRKDGNIVKDTLDTFNDSDFLRAFKEAIRDPEQRKEIISILETYGLLPSADRLPA